MAQLEAQRPFGLDDIKVVQESSTNTYEIEPHHTEERLTHDEE